MLVSCGLSIVRSDDGREWVFRPSFGRIAELGHPHEIVQTFAALHGPHAAETARFVLLTLCDTDAMPLTGWLEDGAFVPGLQPAGESIILARHLMQHGVCGKPDFAGHGGKFSPEFHASEYIASAVVHFGMTQAEAEGLSMTQFQELFAQKFPKAIKAKPPSRDEYREFMAAIKAKKQKAA